MKLLRVDKFSQKCERRCHRQAEFTLTFEENVTEDGHVTRESKTHLCYDCKQDVISTQKDYVTTG